MTEHRPRILYIDDDEALRRLTARSLARRGFEVTLAESGPEGGALAREGRFDLVAVDHYMPGQDGLATLVQLRSLPNPPPVVYVTGSEESSVAVAALKAGAIDYVVKSVGEGYFDLLARAFEQALAQVELRAAKEAAEAELLSSNARLQALLREVNHRVANSLQLVSAFVQMQASALKDDAAKTALTETQRRIQAIAQVHRRLYTSDDVGLVAMDDFLGAIVSELEETCSTPKVRRRMTLCAEPIKLKTDKAVSVGVIVNELVSNACKYAYPLNAEGEVRVRFKGDGANRFLLSVEDDGCGLGGEAAAKGTGLGRKLVSAMAASLQADLRYDASHAGCRAILSAPC